MTLIKRTDLHNYIPKDTFNTCIIDNATKEEIIKMYPSRVGGAYYLDKFNNYIKNKYKIDIREYCIKHLNVNWPHCPISNDLVGFKITGVGLILSNFKKGRISKEHCPKFAAACEKISKERMGAGNPMFGKEAWNTGLTAETDVRMQLIADARTGIKTSEETKEKQRKIRKEHPLKARHTTPHTKESKEIMRIKTAERWAAGDFNRVSSIQVKVREFLQTLNLKFNWVEEHQVIYFSMDFAFPEAKIAIEVQGTYFHIDPRVYPNGPTNAMQRRNFGRDITKRKVCCDQNGWKIIEIWEIEINDGSFKEQLLCKLKEYNLLNE